ncbi:hypothetical protein K501DRAFT_201931 [Backusella circina FSU 941]|nr:hypothetical protein K501DRAFT_201931 [Backusella circina FSU 941]
MLLKSSRITVQLLEPTLYIQSDSNPSNVIRGTINLNLPKTTSIKSLSVNFNGKLETKVGGFDVLDTNGYSIKKTVACQKLALYPTADQPSEHSLVLNAGQTQFGFEMQVPPGLPETVDCADIQVNYNVTAVVEYYSDTHRFLGSSRRLVKDFTKQNIRVSRLPDTNVLSGDNVNPSLDSRTHRCTWLYYQILTDKKSVALGSDLPVTLRFTPLRAGVTIDRINVQMLERRDIYANATHTSQSIHAILPSRNNKTNLPRTALNGIWKGEILYQIPEGRSLIHSTQHYSDFNVTHTLLVSLTLSIPGENKMNQRVQRMMTYQTDIDILDQTVSELDPLKLPCYDGPPPFDEIEHVLGDYERKFVDPPAYDDIFA